MKLHRPSAALMLLTSLAGCSAQDGTSPREDLATVSARCQGPGTSDADRAELVAGNTAFAIDLYRALASSAGADGSLTFSPYSISLALGMTYAGARGDTASQLASTLHFTLPEARLHATFGVLDGDLEARGNGTSDDGRPFRLRVASSLWVQQSFAIQPSFLSTLADDYGVSPQQADFESAPDAARLAIDQWVSDRTEGAIPSLFGPGSIGRDARLVIADAIDFDATWTYPFDPKQTADGPFYAADGKSTSVPLMHQHANIPYTEGDGWQAVVIPYGSGISMLVVLPAKGASLEQIESRIDLGPQLLAAGATFGLAGVTLTLPKFSLHPGSTSLRDRLAALGAPDAFDVTRADFSGITTCQSLAIGDVVHQAFIDVDEYGTHAAAATGVAIVGTWAPSRQAVVTVDHPFLYAIRDDATGTLLFLGRVASL